MSVATSLWPHQQLLKCVALSGAVTPGYRSRAWLGGGTHLRRFGQCAIRAAQAWELGQKRRDPADGKALFTVVLTALISKVNFFPGENGYLQKWI
jgi:hypothetical protein